jgi:hypothetical protein
MQQFSPYTRSMSFCDRLRAIRWIGACDVPSEQITDDEHCAMLLCFPCYAVGFCFFVATLVVMPVYMIGSLVWPCLESAYRVCTGRSNAVPPSYSASSRSLSHELIPGEQGEQEKGPREVV